MSVKSEGAQRYTLAHLAFTELSATPNTTIEVPSLRRDSPSINVPRRADTPSSLSSAFRCAAVIFSDAFSRLQRAAGTNDLNGMTISVLGLTFKAGTDDLRDSPSLAIIGRLRELGATVRAYDPTTTGRLSRIQDSFLEGINVQQSVDEAMREGDVLVILTEWPEFRSLDFEQVKELLSGSVIVDTRNLLDPQSVRAAGLDYDGVGRKA